MCPGALLEQATLALAGRARVLGGLQPMPNLCDVYSAPTHPRPVHVGIIRRLVRKGKCHPTL